MIDNNILYASENANGEFITRTKYEIIKNELESFCEELRKEMKFKSQWKKQPSWGGRIKNKLNGVMRKYKVIPNNEAIHIESDHLFGIYNEFIDLVCWLNETADYIPSKQDFCAYAQISADCYNELMSSGTEEQRLIIHEIDSYLSDMQLNGAQGGVVKERSTEFRLTSQDFGHSIIKKSNLEEAINTISQEKLTPEYWLKVLQSAKPPTLEEKKNAVKQLKGQG